MPQHRYLFLDDGGVLNDNALRRPQWLTLVPQFFVPRLGGTANAWAEANDRTAAAAFRRHETRLEDWHDGRDFLAEQRDYLADWLGSMCDDVGIPRLDDDEAATLSRAAADWIMPQVFAGYPGVADAVRGLGRRFELYTASGGTSHELEIYLETLGLQGAFRRLYGPDLVNTPKLGPEYYRRIFADAGVDAAECIVVDDSPRPLEWAKEAGAFTVLCDADAVEGSDVDMVVASLAEFAGRFN